MADFSIPPLKRCTKGERCVHPNGPLLPATTDYFYTDNSRKDHLTPQCRMCIAARHETHREEKREYARQHRINNPEYQANYRLEHADEIRLTRKKYNVEHREQNSISYSKWLIRTGYKRVHSKTSVIRRRARKRGLPDTFSDSDRQRCLEYWDYTCCVCGRREGFWHTLAKDHWIPLTDPQPDNPGTVSWNIVPMCHAIKGSNGQGDCNHSKFNRHPSEWLEGKFGKRKAKQVLERVQRYFEWVKAKEAD